MKKAPQKRTNRWRRSLDDEKAISRVAPWLRVDDEPDLLHKELSAPVDSPQVISRRAR